MISDVYSAYLLIFPIMLMIFNIFMLKKNILSLLLLMEMFMLLNLLYMSTYFLSFSNSVIFLMSFFTLSVCEACVGIGVLVKISRMTGSGKLDFYN